MPHSSILSCVRARDEVPNQQSAACKMASSNQLTLFQCLAKDPPSKRTKLDRTADKQGMSDSPDLPGAQWDCATNEEDFNSVSEGSSREPGPSANSSCHIPGNQTNNITFHYPTGPTTVVVNSLPSTTQVQSTSVDAPDDVALSPASPTVQPTNIEYPSTVISEKARSFNPVWFTMYQWLEYSVQRDACFCYSCRLFGPGTGTKCE